MSPGILGKKIGMTQVFRADGQAVPVTLLKTGPCTVVQRKTINSDGYEAVQLGLVEFVKPARINKPSTGHLKKAGAEGVKFLREFRLGTSRGPSGATTGELKPGDKVLVDEFKPKEMVDVIGVSKGRGFAGVVRRHHFGGGEPTPGMRMGGQMGNEQVTVRNLEIVDVMAEDNVLVVKGAVPGPNGGYVVVQRSKR
jgi:large subunit ribosomal protein L3